MGIEWKCVKRKYFNYSLCLNFILCYNTCQSKFHCQEFWCILPYLDIRPEESCNKIQHAKNWFKVARYTDLHTCFCYSLILTHSLVVQASCTLTISQWTDTCAFILLFSLYISLSLSHWKPVSKDSASFAMSLKQNLTGNLSWCSIRFGLSATFLFCSSLLCSSARLC